MPGWCWHQGRVVSQRLAMPPAPLTIFFVDIRKLPWRKPSTTRSRPGANCGSNDLTLQCFFTTPSDCGANVPGRQLGPQST